MYIISVHENNKLNLSLFNMESLEESSAHAQPLETPPKKRCIKCKQLLPLSAFDKNKTMKDGLANWCKECRKQYRQDNKKKIAEKRKQHYQNNKEEILEKSKQWAKDNPEKKAESNKNWAKKNPKQKTKHRKRWNEKNPEYQNKRQKKRRKTDLKFNLNSRMAIAIGFSLKGNKNGRSWESLVGYTCEELTKHLKKTIPEGYTWDNFLSGELHIDHIIPKSIFNYTKPNHPDFKRCWALKNLRLLPAKENLKKHDKHKSFQPMLMLENMEEK